jgi:hypothetical protein
MRQKFSTPKRAALAAAAAWILGASAPQAAELEVKNPVPTTYTVVKGDTLWGIASRFLKDPWRWPDVWRMNRDAIKNPHRIYPGDVIALSRDADGQWQLSLQRPATRLSPTVRIEQLDAEAIPSIPPGDIEPYLSKPLVTGPEGLSNAPQIVAGRDPRVIRGSNDVVYVLGLDPKAGDRWHIYRPGRTLTALDTGEVLGYEQRYVGTGKVERFADISTLRITASTQEILLGDRLVPVPPEQLVNFAPHAPDRPVDGRIIATGRDSIEVGSGWIVTIDKGAKDGIDVGAVLAIYRVIAPIPDPRPSKEPDRIDYILGATRFLQPDPGVLQVPDERSGLMFVFRVFDRVSYALVVNATDPVNVGDHVRKP